MGLYDTFRRLRQLIRTFTEVNQYVPPSEEYTPNVNFLNTDAECISFIRRFMDKEDAVLHAVSKIKSPMRIATLALDPDLQPFIRIAALGRLGPDDDMRIRIARSDHDPAVAIAALLTLINKKRIKEAHDAKHDVVRLYASTTYLE